METSRPLPKRQLPPLRDVSAISEPVGLTPPVASEPRPKKRSPRKKPSRASPELVETEDNLPRTLPDLQQGDQQPPSGNVSVTSKGARSRRRQANRRAQKSPRDPADVIANGHAITKILSDEDVVAVERLDPEIAMTPLPGAAKHGVVSQQHDKVFVQTNSGFTSRTNDWLANRANAAMRDGDDAIQYGVSQASDVALSFHRGFLFFALLLHGVLAGIAVWEVVVAFLLNSDTASTFPSRFGLLAQPLQTTFYILLIFCLVSAMDRFNVYKHGPQYFSSLVRANVKSWMVLFYFLSFMFNVGLVGLDQWLATSDLPVNSTLTSDFFTNNLSSSVMTWHVINVLRASCAVIGYFLIAFYPGIDEAATGFVVHPVLPHACFVVPHGTLRASRLKSTEQDGGDE